MPLGRNIGKAMITFIVLCALYIVTDEQLR